MHPAEHLLYRQTLLYRVRAFVVLLAACSLSFSPILAGDRGKSSSGAPLTADEKRAVEAAIAELERLAREDRFRTTLRILEDLARCLRKSLERGNICRETEGEGGESGSTLVDGSPLWDGDAINIASRLLTTDEPHFTELIATLLHEAVHATEHSVAFDTQEKSEWRAYTYEVDILKRLLKRKMNILTPEQLEHIEEVLRVAIFYRDKFCRAAVRQIERERKGERSTGGKRRRNLSPSNPNVRYTIDPGDSSSVLIWEETPFRIVKSLTSSLPALTSLHVYTDREGRDVVYVLGADLSYAQGGTQAFRDLDSDGIPDNLSRATVLELGVLGLPESSAADSSRAEMYVLDWGVDDVYRIRRVFDADNDGLPDSLAAVPFAHEGSHPQLRDGASIFLESPGRIVLSQLISSASALAPLFMYHDFIDSDASGEADVVVSGTELSYRQPDPPIIVGMVQNGDSVLRVRATPSSDVEIWATDSTGTIRFEMIGALTTTSPDWENTASLSRSVDAGEFVKAYDLTHSLTANAPEMVSPQLPEIRSISVAEVLPGEVVTIQGRNFGTSPIVVCLDSVAPVISLRDDAITFVAPPVPQTPLGFVPVKVINELGSSNFTTLTIHADCNLNSTYDSEDIAGGASRDTNANNIPDECECVPLGLPRQSRLLQPLFD